MFRFYGKSELDEPGDLKLLKDEIGARTLCANIGL
jgi:hypothetical protein